MKAIQFIGTQRSGSNLLRVMLHQHPQICSPHPPHILQVMMPFLPMYGDLSAPAAFRKLADDVCTLVELNPVNWNMHFDREVVISRCKGHNLPQLMKAIYELKAEQKQSDIWCCKSMASVHYAAEIENAGIHPFYIFIFRDGRDVALSFMKTIVGEKHIYHLAKQWKEEQELSYALCQRFPERSVMIRYEEFILDPETQLRRICTMLGMDYSPAMLDYAQSDESKETASSGAMWGNLVKPVMKENKQKFLRELSPGQIAIFESVAGSTLVKLGYTLRFPEQEARVFSAETLAEFSAKNARLKKEAKTKAAPSDIDHRKLQDGHIARLAERMQQFRLSAQAHE
jgi:hypothetical protein